MLDGIQYSEQQTGETHAAYSNRNKHNEKTALYSQEYYQNNKVRMILLDIRKCLQDKVKWETECWFRKNIEYKYDLDDLVLLLKEILNTENWNIEYTFWVLTVANLEEKLWVNGIPINFFKRLKTILDHINLIPLDIFNDWNEHKLRRYIYSILKVISKYNIKFDHGSGGEKKHGASLANASKY